MCLSAAALTRLAGSGSQTLVPVATRLRRAAADVGWWLGHLVALVGSEGSDAREW